MTLDEAITKATTEEFFEHLLTSPREALLELRIPDGHDRWNRRWNWAAMVSRDEASSYRNWLPGAQEFRAWLICRAESLGKGIEDLRAWLERAEEETPVDMGILWNAYYPGGVECAA